MIATSLFDIRSGPGRELRCLAVFLDATYGGLLQGWPDASIRQGRLDESRTWAGSLFGKRPVYVVPPVLIPAPEELGRVDPRLPSYRGIAWLFSDRPVRDPSADGSNLVVVWFQEEKPDSLEAAVSAAARGLPWESHAEEWWY